jgi:hypothetical protein
MVGLEPTSACGDRMLRPPASAEGSKWPAVTGANVPRLTSVRLDPPPNHLLLLLTAIAVPVFKILLAR